MERIELARAGRVTCRNHVKLGYQRVLRGVYGQPLALDGMDRYGVQRHQFWRLASAVVAAYPDKGLTLYGVSGLQALGVALPERLEDWLTCHVQVTHQVYRPQRPGVVAHRTHNPAPVWRVVSGLPVVHPVDLWVHVSGATDDELIEIGDGLMRKRVGPLTMELVVSRLGELAGKPGVKRIRRLLKWCREGTESIYETRTRLALVHAGLPCPVVDLPVFCRAAGMTYHADMGYEDEKTAVEYDGGEHSNLHQMRLDANRRRHLQDDGWMVISVTADQLDEPAGLVRSVEQALVLRRAAQRQAW